MVSSMPEPARAVSRGRLVMGVLGYGVAAGVLLAVLDLVQYRFLVLEHSLEIYVALIAALFAGIGIWLGRTLRRRQTVVEVREVAVPVAEPFVRDEQRLAASGITPRELEILERIAEGLSNREIAERLFVSESTVKTHSQRLFSKLGARRRTQAVQLGREARLIP